MANTHKIHWDTVKLLTYLILIILLASPVSAAIRYVDKDNGCPGDGSTGNPYCTIAGAVAVAVGGDTIRIRDAASAYTETIQITRSGSVGNPITVEPDVGHNPTLYNTGNGSQCANFWLIANYWTIQNLNFNATGQNACTFGAILVHANGVDVTGNKILNNTFKGWGNSNNDTKGMVAIVISGGTGDDTDVNRPRDTLIENNVFDTNRYLALHIMRTKNTTVRNNEFKGMKCGVGWDATNTLGIHATYHNRDLTLDGNTFHDFDAYADCTVTIVGFPTYAAFWCDVSGYDAVLKNNIIYNLDQSGDPTDLSRPVWGMFIEAGCKSHTVERNVFSNVKTAAMVQAYHVLAQSEMNIYRHNTSYGGGYGMFAKQGVAHFKNNIIKNASIAAICHGCGDGSPSLLDMTYNYNLYDDGASQTKIGAWSGVKNLTDWRTICSCDANSSTGDPLFVNAATRDFHLQAKSPARGAGESGVDIGAFPFTGTGSHSMDIIIK